MLLSQEYVGRECFTRRWPRLSYEQRLWIRDLVKDVAYLPA